MPRKHCVLMGLMQGACDCVCGTYLLALLVLICQAISCAFSSVARARYITGRISDRRGSVAW